MEIKSNVNTIIIEYNISDRDNRYIIKYVYDSINKVINCVITYINGSYIVYEVIQIIANLADKFKKMLKTSYNIDCHNIIIDNSANPDVDENGLVADPV